MEWYGVMGLALVVSAQTIAIWKMSLAIRSVARIDDRLAHFAEALALLTDATEAGLSTVAGQLEQVGERKATPPATRVARSRRIASAVRRGRSVEDIAAAEALSESEVRLHVQMAAQKTAKGGRGGSVRV